MRQVRQKMTSKSIVFSNVFFDKTYEEKRRHIFACSKNTNIRYDKSVWNFKGGITFLSKKIQQKITFLSRNSKYESGKDR